MVQSIHGKDRQIQERNGYSNIKDAQIGVSHPSEWLFIRFFIELDEEGQGNQGKNQVEVFVRKLLFFYQKSQGENQKAKDGTKTLQRKHSIQS